MYKLIIFFYLYVFACMNVETAESLHTLMRVFMPSLHVNGARERRERGNRGSSESHYCRQEIVPGTN